MYLHSYKIMKRIFITAVMIFVSLAGIAQERKITASTTKSPAMAKFINDLMSKMTIEEKIGQLNLVSVGFDVTGPIVSKNVEEKIQKGSVGGVFNTFTPIAVKKLQEMAVTKTRLKIPLLFGYDVIHGH